MVHLLLGLIYLAFIGLGLPDGVLGAAWPSMYPTLRVPISYAGILSMIIAGGTILSSLQSDRLTKRFGTARVTVASVAMTALALAGFACTSNFWVLCLLAIPYGLGAGSVDAALNNDVALHYTSRHMSWLHCMWGVGAIAGPYIMGYILTHGWAWQSGYLTLAIIQCGIVAALACALPLWKRRPTAHLTEATATAPIPLRTLLRLPGAKSILTTFFAYCALEQTLILWTGSYLHLHCHIPAETAATYGAIFFVGITVGRMLNGFLTLRFSDSQLIRGGQALILLGILLLLLPLGTLGALAGVIVTGLGCAPIYPCIIHSTPTLFGAHYSQALIGVQMASAYIGTCLMPPLFGLFAQHLTIATLPLYLIALCALMAIQYRHLLRLKAH